MKLGSSSLLEPDWPAPDKVSCVVTKRAGGRSTGPYQSLNLALHVGDDADSVASNRALVQAQHPGVQSWQWLDQVHSATVHRIEKAEPNKVGDGLVTTSRGVACCILTADCLPVLICNEAGTEVAAVHGGWRGLAAGIVGNTVSTMQSQPESLLVWLGPAIGPCHFEVGAEVREQFLIQDHSQTMNDQFARQDSGKYLADLYGIARTQLQGLGVERVFGGGFCTYCDSNQFFSYRRDGASGRMLSAIYLV